MTDDPTPIPPDNTPEETPGDGEPESGSIVDALSPGIPLPAPASIKRALPFKALVGSVLFIATLLTVFLSLFTKPGNRGELPELKRALAQLEEGSALLFIPDAIALDSSRDVHLVLHPEWQPEAFIENLHATGTVDTIQFPVASRMKAYLISRDSDFEILSIPPGHDSKPIFDSTATTWTWDVKALQPGDLKLRVGIDAHLPLPNGAVEHNVFTSPPARVEVKGRFSRYVLAFIRNNWQWLWAVLLVPGVRWVWIRWKDWEDGKTPRPPFGFNVSQTPTFGKK